MRKYEKIPEYTGKFHIRNYNILLSITPIFFSELYSQCSKKGFYVFCKVRLEDLIKVEADDKYERERQRTKVKSRHIDFVVCNKKLQHIMGFELDDASHNSYDAKKTDALKDEIFKQIGIPLYRISADDDY